MSGSEEQRAEASGYNGAVTDVNVLRFLEVATRVALRMARAERRAVSVEHRGGK